MGSPRCRAAASQRSLAWQQARLSLSGRRFADPEGTPAQGQGHARAARDIWAAAEEEGGSADERGASGAHVQPGAQPDHGQGTALQGPRQQRPHRHVHRAHVLGAHHVPPALLQDRRRRQRQSRRQAAGLARPRHLPHPYLDRVTHC